MFCYWNSYIFLFFEIIALGNLAKSNYSKATQSGAYTDGSKSYVADLALDGNYKQAWSGGSCSHTQSGMKPAWWQLDLQNISNIHRVVFYYRNDSKYFTIKCHSPSF